MTISRRDLHGALALGLGGMLAACGSVLGGEDPVQVRLENASTVTFETATLFSADGSHTFQDVAPGAMTPYVTVSMAYRSATTEVVIPGDTLRLQVIDFVGEEPLDPGRYTYVLSVIGPSSPNPSLGQEFRRDN
jgi:hypothetical protein